MAQAPPTVRIFREPGDAEKKAWGLEQPFSEDNVTACFQKDAQAPTTQIFNTVRKNLQAYYCRVEDEADSGGLFTMPLHQRWGRGVIALNRKATPGGGGRVAERKQLAAGSKRAVTGFHGATGFFQKLSKNGLPPVAAGQFRLSLPALESLRATYLPVHYDICCAVWDGNPNQSDEEFRAAKTQAIEDKLQLEEWPAWLNIKAVLALNSAGTLGAEFGKPFSEWAVKLAAQITWATPTSPAAGGATVPTPAFSGMDEIKDGWVEVVHQQGYETIKPRVQLLNLVAFVLIAAEPEGGRRRVLAAGYKDGIGKYPFSDEKIQILGSDEPDDHKKKIAAYKVLCTVFDPDYVGKLAGKLDQNVERGLELLKGLFGLDFLTTHHFPTHVIKRVPANSQKRKLEVSIDDLCKVQKLMAEARGANATRSTLKDLVSALSDMSPQEFGVAEDQDAGQQREAEQPQAMGAVAAAGAGSGAGEGGAEGARAAGGGGAAVAAAGETGQALRRSSRR